MEGIKEIALAGSESPNDYIKAFLEIEFKHLQVADEDDKISVSEYLKYRKKVLPDLADGHLQMFGLSVDGSLDFNDYISLNYIVDIAGYIPDICRGCSSIMFDINYFSCSVCFFNIAGPTYDLCSDCYRSKRFGGHEHVRFFHNQMLLRASWLTLKDQVSDERQSAQPISQQENLSSHAFIAQPNIEETNVTGAAATPQVFNQTQMTRPVVNYDLTSGEIQKAGWNVTGAMASPLAPPTSSTTRSPIIGYRINYMEIFHTLIEKGLITPEPSCSFDQPRQPDNALNSSHNYLSCEYHKGEAGHSTENCPHLKSLVEELLATGLLKIEPPKLRVVDGN